VLFDVSAVWVRMCSGIGAAGVWRLTDLSGVVRGWKWFTWFKHLSRFGPGVVRSLSFALFGIVRTCSALFGVICGTAVGRKSCSALLRIVWRVAVWGWTCLDLQSA
jgi:hypothetical protein